MATAHTNFTPEDVVRDVVNRGVLLQMGERAVLIIKQRTAQGKFLSGPEQYSTTPLPLPMGMLAQHVQSAVLRRLMRGEEDGRVFMNRKSRRLWIVLQGGYKRFRELSGRESDKVTLNWSGTMLRAMKVVNVNEKEGSVTLGFTESESAQRADYQQNQGVGKSRRKRVFFALSEAEIAKLAGDVKTAF